MLTPPRITIITPSFNQGAFIERTIRSVLDQGYANLEYIVVDGGSQDKTINILRKYEKNLKWISEKDNGQADAINKGIRMSTGDIVAYLNSDDTYVPGTLNRVSSFFTVHPEVMWVTGKCRIIDEQDREVRRPITAYKNFLLRHYRYNLLLVTNPISQPATFWRRKVVDELGLFNINEHLVMDYDYWLRIGRKYDLSVLDEYLASFRVHTASKTSSSFMMTFRSELELAKKYSPSKIVHALHWLNYGGIAMAYLMMKKLERIRK